MATIPNIYIGQGHRNGYSDTIFTSYNYKQALGLHVDLFSCIDSIHSITRIQSVSDLHLPDLHAHFGGAAKEILGSAVLG